VASGPADSVTRLVTGFRAALSTAASLTTGEATSITGLAGSMTVATVLAGSSPCTTGRGITGILVGAAGSAGTDWGGPGTGAG
jgi:hypothetical protein